MKSWDIAQEDWLAAIQGNAGSYNSYPHIRNHEIYTNSILKQLSEVESEAELLHMSPVEKYVLLASMLLHDIGRIKSSDGHAVISQKIIKENFAELGIENKALANIIADICCYHNCTDATAELLDLHEHSISPYGIIHVKRLAVFLKFITLHSLPNRETFCLSENSLPGWERISIRYE
jgi:hypothetical protein